MNYLVNKHSSKIIYNYHPKTRDELKELIDKLIEERGLEANLNDIDTSAIIDMSKLFMGSLFNGDISKWNVSNVISMYGMFAYSKFTGDISKWNVSIITNTLGMFVCSSLQNNPPAWYCD